jgi:hypothetical protein
MGFYAKKNRRIRPRTLCCVPAGKPAGACAPGLVLSKSNPRCWALISEKEPPYFHTAVPKDEDKMKKMKQSLVLCI